MAFAGKESSLYYVVQNTFYKILEITKSHTSPLSPPADAMIISIESRIMLTRTTSNS